MVDSVRFPPSIGGSGKTFTSDANPQTGVFNGGHRINFFPMLADTVAAAGYVSQYAQAIDGAAANADKAEDAKGYVEAVAGTLKNGILDYYKRLSSVCLDFAAGTYSADDGTKIITNDLKDIVSFSRASPKWVKGINGYLQQVPVNEPAREWGADGKCRGISREIASTNAFLYSSAFDNVYWDKQNIQINFDESIKAPDGALGVWVARSTSSSGFSNIRRLEGFSSGWMSVFVKLIDGYNLFGMRSVDELSSYQATFNLENGSIVSSDLPASINYFGDGWWRVGIKVPANTLRVIPINLDARAVELSHQGIAVWGAQYEAGLFPFATSYIPTNGTASTRAEDVIVINDVGRYVDPNQSSIIFFGAVYGYINNQFFYQFGDSEYADYTNSAGRDYGESGVFKYCASSDGGMKVYVSGELIREPTLPLLPDGMSLKIGHRNLTTGFHGFGPHNGWIDQVLLLPFVVGEDEGKEITL
tara:strand:+ start:2361 stop:3782 length:1422 start_codon:yes stop_codon:yes gene_type:complete